MANTYSWSISELECLPEYEGKTNVVTAIFWRRQITDEKGNTVDVFGRQNIDVDTKVFFTPYDQLTKNQVEQWLISAMGAGIIADLDAHIAKQLAIQSNPPVIAHPIPWEN